MAIVISGVNNNDKITASDGTIDLLSGVNYTGIITAPAITSTGNITAASINIGDDIQIGNAGIITATTLVGNVTGNVNHTSNLLLQISGSEKLRIANSGAFGLNGTNYGSSGQVLTSQGSGSSPVWSTINSDAINEGNTKAEVVDTGTDGHFKVETEGLERLRIDSSGRLGIQGAPTRALLEVRASGGSNTMLTALWGANEGTTAGTLSDNTDKAVRMGIHHYDTDALPYGLLVGSSTNSVNNLTFGGGTSLMNAATEIKFNTAANQTTTSGTERLRIASTGAIGLSGANYGSSGQVLTSQGSGSAPQWATPTSTSARATPSTGGGTVSGQRVASDLTYSSGSNGTTVVLGNVSSCSTSSIYALEISLTYMHNGSTNHGYLTGYIFQTGKTYGLDGAYYSEQHYDWYYNYVWSRALLPWDPSGTQSLSMYISNAYNTNSGNKFYVDIANKLQNLT